MGEGHLRTIGAFSDEQAARLSNLSLAQLRYWDRIGFYSPSFAAENRRQLFSRVYSFKDIVALRVLGFMRTHRVSLQHLREVSDKLSHLAPADLWTKTRLHVVKRQVVWSEPGTARPQVITSQQYVVPEILLEAVAGDTRHAIAQLNVRERKQVGQVVKSRYVSHNAPVLAGTRIPVGAIQRFKEAGYGIAAILKEYPDLKEKDVRAALAYAA